MISSYNIIKGAIFQTCTNANHKCWKRPPCSADHRKPSSYDYGIIISVTGLYYGIILPDYSTDCITALYTGNPTSKLYFRYIYIYIILWYIIIWYNIIKGGIFQACANAPDHRKPSYGIILQNNITEQSYEKDPGDPQDISGDPWDLGDPLATRLGALRTPGSHLPDIYIRSRYIYIYIYMYIYIRYIYIYTYNTNI